MPPDEPSSRPTGETPNEIRKGIVRWGVILGVIALAYWLIVPPPRAATMERFKPAQAKNDTSQVGAALKLYFTEYGFHVMGNANAPIMNTLQGGNAQKIVFYETMPKSINAQGELIDPWGTPYRFDFSDPQNPRVWSCGKDRRDDGGAEGSDDIPSWR